MRATFGACRCVSSSPMYTTHGSPSSAHAVAAATPCWPAPVSAMIRSLPSRFASSACPSALLILCAPVCARSSRFSQMLVAELLGQPARVRDRRRPADEVAEQLAELRRGTPGRRGAPTTRRRARRAPGSAPRARSVRRRCRTGRGRRGPRSSALPPRSSSALLSQQLPELRRRDRRRASAPRRPGWQTRPPRRRPARARASRSRSPSRAIRPAGMRARCVERAVHVDLERLEIAGVHADRPPRRSRAPVQILVGVGLDERAQAEIARGRRACATSSFADRQAAISSTASAPAARDSISSAGWTRKSLRSTGSSHAMRAARRSASEPSKCVGSVSTEIAAAPAGRVGPRLLGGVAIGDLAGRRRGALDLGDHRGTPGLRAERCRRSRAAGGTASARASSVESSSGCRSSSRRRSSTRSVRKPMGGRV